MTDKMMDLEAKNPRYFRILTDRSPYSLEEIRKTLEEIRGINAEIVAIKERAYACLEDEEGPMSYMLGFASDAHKKLNDSLAFDLYEIDPHYSENSHIKNCIPVRKWQKEIKSANRQIKKIIEMIEPLE
jgi:hypothetical protein